MLGYSHPLAQRTCIHSPGTEMSQDDMPLSSSKKAPKASAGRMGSIEASHAEARAFGLLRCLRVRLPAGNQMKFKGFVWISTSLLLCGALSRRGTRLLHLDGRHPQAALAALEAAGPDVWVTLDAERPREGAVTVSDHDSRRES